MNSDEDDEKLKEKYPLAFEHIEREKGKLKLPGQLLRDARLKKGLTLGEAMSAIGLNHPTSAQFLYRVEKGLQRLPFDHLEPMCRLYGINDYTLRKLYADVEIRKVKEKYGLK